MFGAWDRDPGHWEAVLPKKRSADLLGFLRRFGGQVEPLSGVLQLPWVVHQPPSVDLQPPSDVLRPLSGLFCPAPTAVGCPPTVKLGFRDANRFFLFFAVSDRPAHGIRPLNPCALFRVGESCAGALHPDLLQVPAHHGGAAH